jgi:hypothetical protein
VQISTEHPELVEGPWEIATVSGIDETLTSSSGPAGHEQFHWQTISIRVYHREGGKEVWGYFATEGKASPQSYSLEDDHSLTLFDGERLRIHFVDVTDRLIWTSLFPVLPERGPAPGRISVKPPVLSEAAATESRRHTKRICWRLVG